jgi:hypothetical protein
VTSEATSAPDGSQVLIGLAAVVLGILALALGSMVLIEVGLLCLGVGVLTAGRRKAQSGVFRLFVLLKAV